MSTKDRNKALKEIQKLQSEIKNVSNSLKVRSSRSMI